MYQNLSYDITKDFEPIAIIGSVPHVIVVNPTKFPKNDLKSIIEEIRNTLVNTTTPQPERHFSTPNRRAI
jgi:tripartite-type tricarboxylate transporter receptor subunit TctC